MLENLEIIGKPINPPAPVYRRKYLQGVHLSSYSSTLVIEDAVLERRLRRPGDLARFAIVLVSIAAASLLSYLAQSTATGIGQDISQGANRLPSALLYVASFVSGLGALAFPVAVAFDLILRRRARQLMEAIAGLLITVALLSFASWTVTQVDAQRLLLAFAGTTDTTVAVPLNLLIGGLAAMNTVARTMSRHRWNFISGVVIGSIALSDIISGGITTTGLLVSILAGWAVGLLIRYLLGTDTTRPPGNQIADTLATVDLPLSLLRAAEVLESGRGYDASTLDGRRLDLIVLDRDLEGAGLAQAIYRSIRLRDDSGGSGTSMRRRLERIALNSWAISTAGIRTPNLISVAEVGPDAAVLAFDHLPGRRFDVIDHKLADAELAGAWEIVRDLHAARIAHRSLTAESFVLGSDGQVYLTELEDGAIAASDVLLRIDLAEALCTLSMRSSPERAITAARYILGDATITKALPALQLVAFSNPTRDLLKKNKNLLTEIRNTLLTLLPEGSDDQSVEIERVKPRTLITIAAGTLAAYLLLGQLTKVNLIELISSAKPSWALAAFGFSVLTYIAATINMLGVVPERLSIWKTFQTQWAASFATLVAPPTLGSVAINIRYLTKQRLNSAVAAASIALVQVLAFISHISFLLIMAIVAGTSSELAFRPSRTVIIAVFVIALAIAFALSIPNVRDRVGDRVKPILGQVVPRFTALANQPLKLLAGVGGVILLNLSYIGALYASVRAFTGDATIVTIAVVYLAGSVIGQVAPTPGGLGAIEAAIAAGLTTAGVDAGVAVSATLLFRFWTFWFPTIPGWLAFNNLQRTGNL